ncbi:MAG: enoyl-CoA hydratase/isomerase family protein [Acidobacteriia bacterium]|nr:enoyl-CoA hydratase/isomerase family protein [Terriglobia bacterium]
MVSKYAELSFRGHVAQLTLNRPPLNVMNLEMIQEINTALAHLLAEDRCQAVLLRGAGKAFSAGVDVADHVPERTELMIQTFHRTFHLLNEFDVPTIASVHGMALGGGFELATFCDFVIASREAKLGLPEIKVGVFPPVACAILTRLCNPRRALELILTGESISGEEAERIGLVNRAVESAELDIQTWAFLDRILVNSNAVVKMARKAIRASRGKPFAGKLDAIEDIYLNELMKLEDAQEGLNAFMEKRPPAWKNR